MAATAHPFQTGLDRTGANFVPLTPVSFLTRAAAGFGSKPAVIDGDRRYSLNALLERCKRLASALGKRGVGRLDTVAIIASNIPEMIEAHFAVPMLGAVLNPINTRLDAATIAFSLNHDAAKAFIVERRVRTPGEGGASRDHASRARHREKVSNSPTRSSG